MQNNYMHVGDKKRREKTGVFEILEAIALVTFIGALIYMIGIAGGVETDALTLLQASKRFVTALIVMTIDAAIFFKAERNNKNEFDRL